MVLFTTDIITIYTITILVQFNLLYKYNLFICHLCSTLTKDVGGRKQSAYTPLPSQHAIFSQQCLLYYRNTDSFLVFAATYLTFYNQCCRLLIYWAQMDIQQMPVLIPCESSFGTLVPSEKGVERTREGVGEKEWEKGRRRRGSTSLPVCHERAFWYLCAMRDH